MAQRIATEYVNAKLQLTGEEMTRFVRFFDEQQVRSKCKCSITAVKRWFSRIAQGGKKSA